MWPDPSRIAPPQFRADSKPESVSCRCSPAHRDWSAVQPAAEEKQTPCFCSMSYRSWIPTEIADIKKGQSPQALPFLVRTLKFGESGAVVTQRRRSEERRVGKESGAERARFGG